MPPDSSQPGCESCDGYCCKFVTVQIPAPRRPVDMDEIRWFLAHDGLAVFIDDGAWFLRIDRPCRHLTPEGRCGVHETRFLICRQHDPADCERSGRPMPDTLFGTREEFERWRRAQVGARRRLTPPGR